MTCIVGLIDKTGVYIGGDSAGVAGHSITVRADEKVFANGDFILGFTSSFRMGDVLRYNAHFPKRHPDEEVNAFMVRRFVPACRAAFKEAGFLATENSVETGGVFLMGYEGRLFRIDQDFQVGESTLPYEAVGPGSDIALGALYALAEADIEATDKIKIALLAAEEFNTTVRRPFNIVFHQNDDNVVEEETE